MAKFGRDPCIPIDPWPAQSIYIQTNARTKKKPQKAHVLPPMVIKEAICAGIDGEEMGNSPHLLLSN